MHCYRKSSFFKFMNQREKQMVMQNSQILAGPTGGCSGSGLGVVGLPLVLCLSKILKAKSILAQYWGGSVIFELDMGFL